MAFVRFLSVVIACVVLIGCTPKGIPVEQPDVTSTESLKANLQITLDNGELGSEMMGIEEGIEAMKATDAAKAEELAKDLQALQSAGDPEKVKAKAKEMIGKL